MTNVSAVKAFLNYDKSAIQAVDRPHKYALLLALINLYEKNPSRPNKFNVSDDLELEFKSALKLLSPNLNFSPAMIENPFFYLQSDGFWFLHIKNDKVDEYEYIRKHKKSRFTVRRLKNIFSHASLDDQFHNELKDSNNRKQLLTAIKALFIKTSGTEPMSKTVEKKVTKTMTKCNQFVRYLNSLQRVGGSNENALAESQVCNEDFTKIQVEHPLTEIIYQELVKSDGRHVVLTGHAGDGKSTLAMAVLKRLRGWESDRVFEQPPKPREDLGDVAVIKDLSERDRNSDGYLLDEWLQRRKRFLLVSNTGTLLDIVQSNADEFDETPVELENRILEAIGSTDGSAELELRGVKFVVFNLALIDNMELAREVFERMLAPERWEICRKLECRSVCPIFANVSLLCANNKMGVNRVFLAYRRMYEYGVRLTMRQFTEHLSYLITSGLGENELLKLLGDVTSRSFGSYLFFNRFFGDDGCDKDVTAHEMRAVREIYKQQFGERPCAAWEHKLWLLNAKEGIKLADSSIDAAFEKLRRQGAIRSVAGHIKPNQAREQVRRMLFFLATFSEDDDFGFIKQYLGSESLLDWIRWQDSETKLGFHEKNMLESKIFHVLQESFTGVRLPECATQTDRRLYVTLSRGKNEVRQSAQVVLAEIDWSSVTSLRLKTTTSATGAQRRELRLIGRGVLNGVELALKVPFLDYVMMRHLGEQGQVLDGAYRERLDSFKAQVQCRTTTLEDERIMLVRLKTDHTFRRQCFAINKNRLEVTDVF